MGLFVGAGNPNHPKETTVINPPTEVITIERIMITGGPVIDVNTMMTIMNQIAFLITGKTDIIMGTNVMEGVIIAGTRPVTSSSDISQELYNVYTNLVVALV